VTGCGLGDLGLIPDRQEFFSGGGVKRPSYEADHPPPSIAEFKNVELYLHCDIFLDGVVVN
jgi:hypothetical protein